MYEAAISDLIAPRFAAKTNNPTPRFWTARAESTHEITDSADAVRDRYVRAHVATHKCPSC